MERGWEEEGPARGREEGGRLAGEGGQNPRNGHEARSSGLKRREGREEDTFDLVAEEGPQSTLLNPGVPACGVGGITFIGCVMGAPVGQLLVLLQACAEPVLSHQAGRVSGRLTKVERGGGGGPEWSSVQTGFLPSEFDEILFPKVLSAPPCSACHTPRPGRHIGRKVRGQRRCFLGV